MNKNIIMIENEIENGAKVKKISFPKCTFLKFYINQYLKKKKTISQRFEKDVWMIPPLHKLY